MKTYINIFILLLSYYVSGQYPVITTSTLADGRNDINFLKKGNYAVDTNNERDQYVGLWRYEQNGVLFELNIIKKDQYLNASIYNGEILHYDYCDEVRLKYKLIKNGVILHNNLYFSEPQSDLSYGIKQGIDDYMDGSILDYTRNVVVSFSIKKLTGIPNKIKFALNPNIYTLKNPSAYYEDGQLLFNIPLDEIEMVKVE